MPWVVGIDEAGYGPNLGPLVQAAVAVRLPDADPTGWEALKPVVRRCGEKDDGRLLVDDSKKVYTRGGLEALEQAVLEAVPPLEEAVGELLAHLTLPWVRGELDREAWFDPAMPIPLTTDLEGIWFNRRMLGERWVRSGDWPGVNATFGPFLAAIVPASRFNRIVDESGSKGTVLARGLVELLAATHAHLPTGDELVQVHCDKLGGRNHYAALVQAAFPDGWVVAERESADESRYRVERLGRPVTVTFCPRADCGSVAVALASMLCKYLREVCMRQFNRFWQQHVPGLKPTAGYPGDAKRFYDAIREAVTRLGLTEDQVWRKR